MTDDQFVDALRRRQTFKRIAATTLVVAGLIISASIAAWGMKQRARLSQSFDELAALTHPTTQQTVNGLQLSRDASSFSLGAVVGMLFMAGLSMVFLGLLLLNRRKDRLLLAQNAAIRRAT